MCQGCRVVREFLAGLKKKPPNNDKISLKLEKKRRKITDGLEPDPSEYLFSRKNH
jgi:hypothetical protein